MVERILKGYRFRIYPTKGQKELFQKSFGSCRFVWNYMLNFKKEQYLKDKITIRSMELSRKLTEIKKLEEYKWLNDVCAQSLQQELRDLDRTFTQFYKKSCGFPRFKDKRDGQSYRMPQKFYLRGDLLQIPKSKEFIKVERHKEFGPNCRFLFVTIKMDRDGRYYAIFQVEEDKVKKCKKAKKAIGIDLGITNLMTFSNGKKIKNPKVLSRFSKKQKYLCRQHTKKKRDGKNRERIRLKRAKMYKRITNIKLDFIHKQTSRIVNENQVIICETLRTADSARGTPYLAGAIYDASWYEIQRQLEYKSLWNDRQFIRIDKWFPSSKMCSSCHYINQSLKLSDRNWVCPKCEKKHDRDINAAKNILSQGLTILGCGTQSVKKHGKALVNVAGQTARIAESMNHDAVGQSTASVRT